MRRRTVLGALCGSLSIAGCPSNDGAGDPDDDGDDTDPGGSDGDDEQIDASGDIAVAIDGEPVDLSADRYQAEHADEALAFHLHEGDDQWYMEGTERVTFGEAVDLLPHFGYERADGHDVVTLDDETYHAGDDGTEIAFSVDGETVDPTSYELRDGDDLRLEITTGS